MPPECPRCGARHSTYQPCIKRSMSLRDRFLGVLRNTTNLSPDERVRVTGVLLEAVHAHEEGN